MRAFASLHDIALFMLRLLIAFWGIALAYVSAARRRHWAALTRAYLDEAVRVEPELRSRTDEPAPEPPSPVASPWSLDLLKALEWKRLERLCALYFKSLGFRVVESPFGGDGGVDLTLYAEGAVTPGILVQCKAWSSWRVGVNVVRELFGVMAAQGVDEGIVLTTSRFSSHAITFASGKKLTLIDGNDLLGKLRDRPADDQMRILRAVTSGDFSTPTCPSCGIKMVMRSSKRTRESFWGCKNFPECKATLAMPRGRPPR